MTPRPTRRQTEHRRDRNKANQLKMRVFLTPRPTGRQKEHRRDTNKAHQLKMRVFDTKAHKKTETAQKRQGPQEDRKSTEETQAKQINLRLEFLAPRPTRRQKEHRRDRNKANQLKIRVFGTKAHKKTERAQKRQKQSKST